jgi:hypothetical protein
VAHSRALHGRLDADANLAAGCDLHPDRDHPCDGDTHDAGDGNRDVAPAGDGDRDGTTTRNRHRNDGAADSDFRRKLRRSSHVVGWDELLGRPARHVCLPGGRQQPLAGHGRDALSVSMRVREQQPQLDAGCCRSVRLELARRL